MEFGEPVGERYVGEVATRNNPRPLQPGDVIFNEIAWDGFDGNVDIARVSDPSTARDYNMSAMTNLSNCSIRRTVRSIYPCGRLQGD